MTWRDIEKIMRDDSYDVAVEIRRSGNRYWLRQQRVYFPITSVQFDRLLEGGYIDPDYRVEHLAAVGADQYVYQGR